MEGPPHRVAPLRGRLATILIPVGLALGCAAPVAECPRCDTVVVAALGEPPHLLPPFAWQGVARDIGDLIFERLATLDPERSPLDPSAYTPQLAAQWRQVDSLTWVFRLRPGARWDDQQPVTAADVAFSFKVFQDPEVDALARQALAGVLVTALDEETVQVVFATPRPDQLYDATYHVRVIPRHIWDTIPVASWGDRLGAGHLIGSGPYRLVSWDRGTALTLERRTDSTPVERVVWRFASDPDAAANLLLAGEADLLEALPNPRRRPEFASRADLALVPHSSSVYGFLGFNLAAPGPWQERSVRRALTLALDRDTLAAAILGPGAQVPDGPLSPQLWLWETPAAADADSASAAALLDSAGWLLARDGTRRRGGAHLSVDILVPGTSAVRRDMAVAIQERWGRHGIATTITQVDFPVFQERLDAGQFATMIGAWYDEPHPRSLMEQWTRQGWDELNYGHYENRVFDSLLGRAVSTADTTLARRLWREALDTLNADAPAIWLYTPSGEVVAHRRLAGVPFSRFSWLASLPGWRPTAIP